MRIEGGLISEDGKWGPLVNLALVSKFSDDVQFIRENVSDRGLLELLAEEAAELSQSALKLIRIKEDDGYPVNSDKYDFNICHDNVIEEITDVYTCLTLLDVEPDIKLSYEKIKGMVDRIKQKRSG